MQEVSKLGNVTLDFKHYPGEDLYSDGAVEDELLEIVKNYRKEEFGEVIKERHSWPVLYHLSSIRGNIVEWIPMEPTAKVLEVGSGCGAITGTLARKVHEVVCCDLSKRRSEINATRNRECDNVTIHVGNFRDVEPDLADDFDYIFLIGVFEYGQAYISTETPYEDFLKMLLRHLKKGGRIVIAIENRLGLKYFAGCAEDHLGTFFSGIEGYTGESVAKTFSKNGLINIFKSCGIEEYHFYYPYPDYKLMTEIHSDRYLPDSDKLRDNVLNFDRDRLVLFSEKKAYADIIKDGMYEDFANSFEVILGPGFDTVYCNYDEVQGGVSYRTEILMDEAGRTVANRSMLPAECVNTTAEELSDIWENIGKKASKPEEIKQKTDAARPLDCIQVYVDEGAGYSEEKSFFPNVRYDENHEATVSIEVTEGMKAVRIDPAFAPCMVTIKSVSMGGKPVNRASLAVTVGEGRWISADTLIYTSDDPNLEIRFAGNNANIGAGASLAVEMITTILPEASARAAVKALSETRDNTGSIIKKIGKKIIRNR